MYEYYEKGNLYQVNFGNMYGYVQEIGEVKKENDVKKIFVAVYKFPFNDELKNIKKLFAEEFFVGLYYGIPFEDCEGSKNHPVKKTQKGSEFEYDVYKDARTGEFKSTYIYVKCLGKYFVPSNIEFPQYLREDEYNFISGTYRWNVISPYNKFIKQQKTVKGIEHMPPMLRFELCARWWEEGTTLETWNDEYCLNVIEQRYCTYPEERPIKMSFEEVVATMPTKRWRDDDSNEERFGWCSEIESILQQFVTILSSKEKITLRETKKAVKELAISINNLQNEECFVETVEREDLYKFITNLLRVKKQYAALEILEEFADW